MERVVLPVILAILGGGGIGAFVALYKMKPEAQQIIVSSAQGAVIVQSGVIDDLRGELDRLRDEVDGFRTEVARLKGELERVRAERDTERAEKERLQQRVTALEAEVHRLTNGKE